MFYEYIIDPRKGGVQRVSYTLAYELKKRGIESIAVYYSFDDYTDIEKVYLDTFFYKGNLSELERYVRSFKVDLMINQQPEQKTSENPMYSLSRKLGIPLISVFHTSPDFAIKSTKQIDFRHWKTVFRNSLKRIFLMFYHRERPVLRYAYDNSDKFVLLSSTFLYPMGRLLRVNGQKFYVIPNFLSDGYDKSFLMKKKEVLVVSRMEEVPKRISLILKMWKSICRVHEDWKLILVGDGADLSYYQDLVMREHISNVVFQGWQNPLPYYQSASIFLMASTFEGFGMTLIECMQFGVIPVVFDTETVFHDIITTGKDGFLIPEGDRKSYVNAVNSLIGDDTLRNKLSFEARMSVKKFYPEVVVDKWIDLFEKTCNGL